MSESNVRWEGYRIDLFVELLWRWQGDDQSGWLPMQPWKIDSHEGGQIDRCGRHICQLVEQWIKESRGGQELHLFCDGVQCCVLEETTYVVVDSGSTTGWRCQ